MRLVTWNVNSLKVRMPRVLQLLEEVAPDVLCLQETKCEAEAFPVRELADAGYGCVHHSAGRWAGVAVLARSGLTCDGEVRGLPGETAPDEARWVETVVDGVRVCSTYVVNGREVGTEWFEAKLAFLDAMAVRAGELRGARLVIAGDLNVTRDDRDVYDPAAFAGETHVTPDERSRLEAILDAGGLVDAFRETDPDGQVFTWWDYRAGHFHKGLGLRIDYVLAGGLQVRSHQMLRDFRKGTKPSDHAPVLVELAS